MKYLLLSLLISVVSHAGAAGNNRVEKTFDLNKDGKIDFKEVFINKILVERNEDLDFDGTFDQQTTFATDENAEYFKIIDQKKFGSNPKKRISFWHDLKKKKSVSLTQIDKDNDGKWDVEFKTSSDIGQHKDECNQPAGMNEALNLAREVNSIAGQSDEYIITSWGHKVHKSCLDNGGKDWFLDNSKKAIEEGLACMNRLGQAGGRGAAKNFASLTNLLEGKNVQVICNETGYDWGSGTIAHATTSSSQEKDSVLKHPGISVNPASISSYRLEGAAGSNEFVRTIFHEQLHNLGYLHGHDIEYPYACEVCCFPGDEDTASQKNIACKVCSGNYNGSTDVAYLRDISKYGKEFYSSNNAISTNIAFLKANAGNNTGMSYLAYNLADIFNPIGNHLAQKLKANNQLNPEEAEIVERAQDFKDSSLLKTYDSSAKIIADAYYASYKTRDPKAALQLLSLKAKEINAQLALKDSAENSRFVKESLKDGLKKVIFDIWLDEYSGKITDAKTKEELNSEAYRLSEVFGL